MERILVTLLLVIVSVAALIGLFGWVDNHKQNTMNTSEVMITNIISKSE